MARDYSSRGARRARARSHLAVRFEMGVARNEDEEQPLLPACSKTSCKTISTDSSEGSRPSQGRTRFLRKQLQRAGKLGEAAEPTRVAQFDAQCAEIRKTAT